MNKAYCQDCVEAMREMPDGCFDLTVADPPYGLNVTGRHSAMGKTAIVGGVDVPLVALRGDSKKPGPRPNFTPRSTIAPRRTRTYSGSLGEYQSG